MYIKNIKITLEISVFIVKRLKKNTGRKLDPHL